MTSSALWARLLSAAGALLIIAAACSDESTPVATPEVPCETSEDCAGGLCLLSICRDCTSDEVCEGDDAYRQGATCLDGACVSCLGEEGCGCVVGDTCNDGLSCQDGACVSCPIGEEGCPCFGNNTCGNESLVCEGEVCVLDEACAPGTEGCPCGDDGFCGEGLSCEGDICAPDEVCVPGEQGCGCLEDDLCDEGLTCMEDLCVSEGCVLGEEDCPCREDEDDQCDEGFFCNDDVLCEVCNTDVEGCPCDEEGECGEELVCDVEEEICRASRVCADLGCVENQLCEDGQPGIDALCLEACAEGFEFNLDTGLCEIVMENANCRPEAEGSILAMCQGLNRACVEDDLNNTSACTGCLAGFLEENDACRAIVVCADLNCADNNRECTPNTDGSDAVCAGCLMGFEENGGVCERIPRINCREGEDLSILEDCNDRNRVCVEDGEGAECGGCFDGFAEDPNTQQCVRRLCSDLGCEVLQRDCDGEPLAECGACLEGMVPTDPNDPLSQCRDILSCNDITCEEGELCVARDGADPVCSEWPCVDRNGDPDFNQARRENTQTCVDCGILCDDEGQTGRIWPFTLARSNRCICETEPGFYFDTSEAFTALPCDADGDGWVRTSARPIIESGDPALVDNARCGLKTIDRLTLENEYQQRLDVFVCDEGFQAGFECEDSDDCGEQGRCGESGQCECIIPFSIDLYESVRNDDQDELDGSNELDVPAYMDAQDRGRKLLASEITPMTRGCISASGDYNDNGVVDIAEWQGLEPEGADADTIRFTHFSYFVELHEGFFEDIPGEDLDRYVIREKSRCEPGFPVQYDPFTDNSYWQQCTRNRDADFDNTGENALTNHDFAAWGCHQGTESCPMPPPLTDVTPDSEVPLHGLCDEEVTLPPTDGIWRGMRHASQFKCTQLVGDLPDDRDQTAPQQYTTDELTNGSGSGGMQLNRCAVACPLGADVEPARRAIVNTGPLTLNGNTSQAGTALSLVPGVENQVGTAFLTEPFDLRASASFKAVFEFRIEGEGSGLSFIIQNSEVGPQAISEEFFTNGYSGITESVAVEFDVTLNEATNDPNANHVAVLSGGNATAHLAVGNPAFGMDNGELNVVWITYDDPTQLLSVFIAQSGEERPDTPVLTHSIDLLGAVGDRAFFGFGASSGGVSFGRHTVERMGLVVGTTLDIPADPTCADDCDDGDCDVTSIEQPENPALPVITCEPVRREDVSVGEVGFAAVRYIDSPGLYERGCIDEFDPTVGGEAVPWKNLCPGHAQNPDGVFGDGNPGNFGQIICGCNFNYGGPNCDSGCVTSQLHIGGTNNGSTCNNGYCPVNPDGDGGGRRGFWMCGNLSTTSYEGTDLGQPPALRNASWALQGEIAEQGIEGTRLCQDEGCETGWKLK